MFQPAAKAGFGAAHNGQAVQLAQFVRRHPFGRDAPAVFRIEPHIIHLRSLSLHCNMGNIYICGLKPNHNLRNQRQEYQDMNGNCCKTHHRVYQAQFHA